ncbi:terminase ATPase subunit family protein [Alloalcanivorax xenomutans]|uniref:terminase ATPase subunit family protein n=1 Tax=Alloalcanivorax xenomutans TaxID=1094342 RepID=UPI003C3A6A54
MQIPDTTSITQRQHGKILFWLGWTCTEIARHFGRPVTTVHSWKDADGWKNTAPVQKVNQALELRYIQLVMKEEKSGKDFKEIDLLGRQMERMARVNTYLDTGKESDLNPKIKKRNEGQKRKPKKNYFSPSAIEKLQQIFNEQQFEYQRLWCEAGKDHRIRNILKSRQVGATWYFGREALSDTVDTLRNQIFLSASKAQAHVFREYVVQLAQAVDVDLSGDPLHITTDNGTATLYFLGTNSRTAQSYHGNLYLDEYFWIHKFQELRKVASGMAMHKRWRQTYFSTPSALTHDAYPFWTGSMFNRGRRKADRIEVDVSHEALVNGMLCADGQWRQIVTVEDAVAGGCDLFDLDQLRLEYSPDEYANLLMCQFVDDSLSVFPLTEMMGCHVDSWDVWDDFKPFAMRPLGNKEVWLGYDPSGGGDSQACVLVAPPAVPGGKFRIVARFRWNNPDFAWQAEQIRQLSQQYNITYMGIDATGMGAGVYQLVKQFFPMARKFTYSPEVKGEMVLKAQDVIRNRRIEYDAGWNDVTQSFMAIKKALTGSQQRLTYISGRSEETGHADVAWATMHALINEPLEGLVPTSKSRMEIFG